MTEEIAGGEAPVIEPTTTAPEAVVLSPETVTEPVARDYDAEAKDMGWVPENEFRGPKERWKPAQQFVEDGENILPIVRAENKRLKAEIDKINADYATRFERLDKAAQVTIKAAKAQFDRDLAALQTKRDEAVAAGDLQAFKAADKQITDHTANAPKVEDFEEKPAQVSDEEQSKQNQAAQDKWKSENTWFGTDDLLTEAAIGISQRILLQKPNITAEENLRLTDAAMKERFPLKFGGKSGANGHAPVDGGGDPKTPARTDTLTAKLPSEALTMAKQAVKDGTYKSTEEWAKVYFS
jgi:hypothetical protein